MRFASVRSSSSFSGTVKSFSIRHAIYKDELVNEEHAYLPLLVTCSQTLALMDSVSRSVSQKKIHMTSLPSVPMFQIPQQPFIVPFTDLDNIRSDSKVNGVHHKDQGFFDKYHKSSDKKKYSSHHDKHSKHKALKEAEHKDAGKGSKVGEYAHKRVKKKKSKHEKEKKGKHNKEKSGKHGGKSGHKKKNEKHTLKEGFHDKYHRDEEKEDNKFYSNHKESGTFMKFKKKKHSKKEKDEAADKKNTKKTEKKATKYDKKKKGKSDKNVKKGSGYKHESGKDINYSNEKNYENQESYKHHKKYKDKNR